MDQTSDVLSKYLQLWDKLVKEGGQSLYSCRLITLLASLREGGDLNNVALDAIDQLINSQANHSSETVRALLFRALANYTFGRFSEAVRSAEAALQYATKENVLMGKAKMNLAYFIAEDFYNNSSVRDREKAYARATILLSEAEATYTGNQRAKFDDTRGAVAIAFGINEQEVRNGLALCHHALSAATGSPEWEAAYAYYRLHEHRACRRYVEWE
jgi:hypothetical protein